MPLPPSYSAASARAAGLTRGVLRGSRYLRLAHDLTVRLDDAIDECERLQLLASLLPPDAAFSHATAAALLGAPVDAPLRPHVVLTPRRVLPQHSGLVVHARRLGGPDVVVHRDLRLTSGAQTFLDLAAVLPPWELVAVGDALRRAGHMTAATIGERLSRAGRVRGVVRARACAPILSPLAMSRPESLMRYWLVTSDLPHPEPQVPVQDRWGRVVSHGDLGYPEWRVLLEYEGRQHADDEQFGRDIDRYSLMAAGGWLVLRFANRHVHGPTAVVERTRRALVSRGWRSPSS
ncbi:endonuclease domain-containing protein [Blastococcus deserti]|uniref:Endonuclease domain-containing protein n=1 Tax=Blastococcus deserti TaxID=2259033 RepID=A0ABW4XAM9_9ACTN